MKEYKLPIIILPKIRGFNWFPDEEKEDETRRTTKTSEEHSQADAKAVEGDQE